MELETAPHLYADLGLRQEMTANVVGFCRYLRQHGLGVGMGEQMDALRALGKIDMREEDAFRIALRSTIAKNEEELRIFDDHFTSYWYVWVNSENLIRNPAAQGPKTVALPEPRAQKQDLFSISDWLRHDDKTMEDKDSAGYSHFAVNTKKDFSEFGQEELAEVARMINDIAKSLATRFSSRTRKSQRLGTLDLRRSMRHSLRRGGELLDLLRRQWKLKRLKLVLLCDVSKSMDLYSRFLVQFIYAFQSSYRKIETFVFSTSLHRISDDLKTKSMEEAFAHISRHVPDWSGGTRIGASLNQFVEKYALKMVDSSTVVLIISDGWDTGDVVLLNECMADLRRRSRSLIWLNPLKGSPGYEPATRGMQAALPHLDLFASAHNLESLGDLVRSLVRIQKGAPTAWT